MTLINPGNHTRRSSDLSRRSAEVFAEAEQHPITVTRRDGQPLVLMSQNEAEGRAQLLALASQLLAAMAGSDGPIEDRMARSFPWMNALSPSDRQTCSRSLLAAAQASLSTDQPHLALAELTSWRETASAITAGLHEYQPEWLDTDQPVERP